ncbi:MAG: HAMP domain-containing sensor histidine kinase [Candidatus Contendobacter sp.]|nr:HAMP domain-containing sensor histidine kinase [Candidatus Contendobacter sp.]MDG4557973.1 HAMP domain-containing sensor histidine kinase [Candidatus Contendobacter sp.]
MPPPSRLPRLKLRHLLLAVNLMVLWLPLLGLEALRLYDSALLRQTESELIAQAAFVAASYRAALARLAPQAVADLGYGLPLTAPWREQRDSETRWRPRPARLDLAEDTVYPPPPDTIAPVEPADSHAWAVGQELQALLQDAQIMTLAGIAVADMRGTVVATTGPSLGRSLAAFEEVRRALTGEPVSLLRQRIPDSAPPAIDSISRGTPLRVFVAAPILQEQRIVAAVLLWRTPIRLSQVLHGKRYHLLLATVLLLGTVVLMSTLTSFTVVRPLQALVRQAQRATAGEKGAVTPLTRPVTREIAELSEAVAAMARHLEQRADYIRTFAAQVSHEFKTPLAAMRGAVELLRDHLDTMTVTERERFLSHLDQDAARLERLVRRLLELARADVMQASASDRAEVAAVVRRLAARYRDAGLAVSVVEPLPAARVAMAEDVLESILGNLLDNARQHGGDTVTVAVTCPPPRHGTDAALLIEVSDNGPGISAANAARVFEPFFTTDRARGGTGLGLAVVKSLLTAHRGAIELGESATGTRLRIRLPR